MSKLIPLTLAIAGAKGGVGKSMVCSNLAVQFAKANLKVVVLDLDLGAANQHTLFGLPRSRVGWTEWLSHLNHSFSDYITPTKIDNLSVIPASGFIPEIFHLLDAQKEKLLDELKKIEADLVLFDLGAGTHQDNLDFFSLADIKVIVTTPEQTALMNNYEFIKNVIFRALCKLYRHQANLKDLIQEFKETPNMTLPHLVNRIKEVDPWLSENLREMCQHLDIFVVFNQLKKLDEAKLAYRLKKVAEYQLGIALKYPGFVFYNEEIRASVEKMQPISLVHPNGIPSKIFERIAKKLMERKSSKPEKVGEITLAWQQLEKDFHKNRVEQKKAKSFLL